MQTAPADSDAAGHDDQRLAELLEQVTRTLDSGEIVDAELLARQHPQHAERLRELLPTMRAMAEWGRESNSIETNASAGSGAVLTGVLGDFRILGQLGRGGMGVVYDAEQVSMGRRVALKVLPFAALVQDQALERFRNEVRAAAALDHPHIVSIYSVGQQRGIHYYAMQLIRGQSMAELIREIRRELEARTAESPGAVSKNASTAREQARTATAVEPQLQSHLDKAGYRTAAQLGIQAAEALQHAHDQGVLHRDVKPGNLLLDGDGKLHVTDFGLARIEADAGMTRTGALLGTLRYMPPEQASGKRVVFDQRGDVYSLGATLYELLALEPAFGRRDRTDLLRQIAVEDPTPLRKLDRHIPVELETIVQTAMAKERSQRYQTAQDLADDLRRYLANEPIRARRPTIVQRFVKWSQRHAAAVWAIAATLLLTTIVLAASRSMVGRANSDLAAALKREQAAADVARAAELRSGDLLYAADVRLAGEALEHNNVTEALERLSGHVPKGGKADRRGFAWRLLWHKMHQEESTLTGHGPAFDVEYSPDGRWLASSHESGEVVLYDATTRQENFSLAGGNAIMRKLAFSPDAGLLAGLSDDGQVRIWRVRNGSLLVQFMAHRPGPGDLAFHPDGNQLATVAHDTAKLFRLKTDAAGTAIETAATFNSLNAELFAVAMSADGRELACGGRDLRPGLTAGGVWVCDLQSRKVKHESSWKVKVTALAYSGANSQLAIGTDTGMVTLRNLKKRQNASQALRHAGRIYELSFTNDDQHVVVASKDSTAGVWDVVQNRMRQHLQGHEERVYGAAVSPATGRIATASGDGAVKIWATDVSTFSQQLLSELPGFESDSRFAPDGKSLIEVYATGELVRRDLASTELARLLLDSPMLARLGWQAGGRRFVLSGEAPPKPGRAAPMELDYDGDGNLDRIARFGTEGRGIWQEAFGNDQWAAPRLIEEIQVARVRHYSVDVDRDGNAELLSAAPNWGVSRGNDRLIPGTAVGLAAADFDADGDQDLIVANDRTHSVAWYANQDHRAGRPTFAKRQVLTKRLRGAFSVVAADVAGSALPDVVACGATHGDSGRLMLFTNLGDGRFGDAQAVGQYQTGPKLVDAADLDVDGRIDVLAATAQEIVWFRNAGDGSFETPQSVTTMAGACWTRPMPEQLAVVYDPADWSVVDRLPAGNGRSALSPDGKCLAVIVDQQELQVWDVPHAQRVCTIPYAGVAAADVTYTPDGRFLLAAVGDDLRVFSAEDYRLLYDFTEHDNTIRRIAVSADSRLAATVSNDLSVRLWSLAEGRHLRALTGHTTRPHIAAFSPDGRSLATGDAGGAIRLWDVKTGGQLLTLREVVGLPSDSGDLLRDLAFPDDRTLAAIVRDGNKRATMLYQWHAASAP